MVSLRVNFRYFDPYFVNRVVASICYSRKHSYVALTHKSRSFPSLLPLSPLSPFEKGRGGEEGSVGGGAF